WFHLRAYGLQAMREMIRNHVKWANWLATQIEHKEDFKLVSNVSLSLVCFRCEPKNIKDHNQFNQILTQKLNDHGKIYLTSTQYGGKDFIRLQIGGLETSFNDIQEGWAEIEQTYHTLKHQIKSN
ncbi:MAG: pyridoxal-dependent decarboxylase, partial [Pseudomonadota bacterium]